MRHEMLLLYYSYIHII